MLRFWSRPPAFIPITICFLLACVEAGAQSATPETSSPMTLPASTPVILHLKRSLYRKDAKPGQPVEFEVGYDVVLNGQIVIESGTAVTGSFRRVDHVGKGPAKAVLDLGPAQTVSGETVRLVSSSFSSNGESPVAEAVGMGSAAGPALPVLVVASLFQKRVLLDADGWGGVWEVVRTADSVALDPAKQKAAQEQYIANQTAAEAEFCELLAKGNQDSRDRDWALLLRIAKVSGLFGLSKADILRRAGDLDGAIGEYQRVLASAQDLPCSAKYPEFYSGWTPEVREQLLKLSANSHLELAGLYREKRDFVHAISECRSAVQLVPEDERARIGLITTLQDSGDLDAAIAESKEAIRTWPDKFYFHYLLGSVLVKKKDADAAIAELQWALKRAESHLSPANCELGRAFEQKGDLEEAYRQYRIAYRAHLNDEQCRAAYERLKLQLKK